MIVCSRAFVHICSSRRRATSSNIRRYVESSVYAFGKGTTTLPRFGFCILNHQAIVVFFLLAETLESRAYHSFTVDSEVEDYAEAVSDVRFLRHSFEHKNSRCFLNRLYYALISTDAQRILEGADPPGKEGTFGRTGPERAYCFTLFLRQPHVSKH